MFSVAAGLVVWRVTRPPAPVSVSDVLDKFRSAQPSSPTGTGGPARGVYVYATQGSERVSAGVTHHYPARTTLTVRDIGCGLRLRWDALSGRWAQWDLCRTASGWTLTHYVDAHKFLYLQDVHEYACRGFPTIVCTYDNGTLTSVVTSVGPRHVRITQTATGKSVSSGEIEAWLLPNGLPRRVVIHDHGAQIVLGSRVTYSESASFTLISAVPRR